MRFFLRPRLAGRLSPGKQALACLTVRILRHKPSKNTPSCQFWRLKIDFFLTLKLVPQARGGPVFGPRNGPKKQACQITIHTPLPPLLAVWFESQNCRWQSHALPTLCGNARRVQTTQRCWEPCCCRVLRTLLFSMMSVCHSSCYQCVSFYCYIDLRQSPHRIDHLNALQVSDMPGQYIHQTQLHHDTPRSHVSNVCIHCIYVYRIDR